MDSGSTWGTILGRQENGFDTRNGFLNACSQDPILSSVKLIAEPWDCGPGGFQVGSFPPGWTEWNSRFRDNARDFWRGNLAASELADQLCASARTIPSRRPTPVVIDQLHYCSRWIYTERRCGLQRET